MEAITDFYPLLSTSGDVVITMHQKPDGDALGSTLGLSHFLRKLGFRTKVISPTNWPHFLSWLPGCKEVIDYESNLALSESLIKDADFIFCLDFNVFSRTKNMELLLEKSTAVKVLIDHHEEPQKKAFQYGVSDVQKSSTCEMVYDFIADAGYAHLIDREIATCLYTGLMTDTGVFRFVSTKASVHQIVAHFKHIGLNHTAIHEKVYDSFRETRLRFLGNALLNRMEVFYQYNAALMVIPRSDLIHFNTQTGDSEGLVNYMLALEGIKFAAIVIDRDENARKWSFRSKGTFDVNRFARAHFNGGGHKNAAGGISTEPLEDAVRKFKDVLEAYETELSIPYEPII
ncbi:MAG: bifunctional oligoribonuclease/PAP phosphatase NrnA [Chitinophagaceae bacterium]